MNFIRRAALGVAFCAAFTVSSFAQTAPPYTPPTQTYAVTTSSGGTAIALPAPSVGGPLQYGVFNNIGANPISFALGNTNGITVTPGNTIPTIQAGACPVIFVGNGGFIATQSTGGNSTLVVTLQYGNGPLPVSCPGASGGGSGGSVTQGTVPWVDIIGPTSSTAAGITPIVSTSAESSHVLKGSAGNLYSLYVTTGSVAGYLMTFNAATAPADGAVTPVECVWVPASSTVGLTFNSGPPDIYSTGITAVFSSTGPFTKTASATAFFKGRVE